MGDSHTYGEGVPEEQIYPVRLEKKLNLVAGDESIEVLNLGVSGYSSLQGLLLLEKEGLRLSPDYVVVAYGSNDSFSELLGTYRNMTDREVVTLLNRSKKVPSWLMQGLHKSHLYHGMKKGILFLWPKAKSLIGNGETGRVRVPAEEYRANLSRFCRIAEANGFKVIYLNIGNYQNAYSRAMRGAARDEGVDFVNAVEVFRLRLPAIRSGVLYAELLSPYRDMLGEAIESRIYDEGSIYYTVDGGHPNAVGHEMIAEELARILLAREGITPPPGLLPPLP